MKSPFKYLLSFFIFLGLIGLGEDISVSCQSVKYYKETELVNASNLKENYSKCFYFNPLVNGQPVELNVQLLPKEYTLNYNRKVKVKSRAQNSLLIESCPLKLLLNKSHTPRKSIEHHLIS